MSGGTATHNTFELARAIAEQEAAHLDARRWDDWLALYAGNCEFWVPTHLADGTLASDPLRQVSHIYYTDRDALADRVRRFTSNESVASSPAPLTLHHQTNFSICCEFPPDQVQIMCNWSTHWYLPATREYHCLFGRQRFQFIFLDDRLLISRKHVEIINDYIPAMIDIYML